MFKTIFKRSTVKNPKAEGLGAFAAGLYLLSNFIVPIIEKINKPIFLSKTGKRTFFKFFPNYINVYSLLVAICIIFLIIFGLFKYFTAKEPWHYDPLRRNGLLIVTSCFAILTIFELHFPIYSTILRLISLAILCYVIYKISRKE